MSHSIDDPSLSVSDMVIERIQDALNREVGQPDSCERPNGHSGPHGWFVSHCEREDAILEGRCGGDHAPYSGVIRA